MMTDFCFVFWVIYPFKTNQNSSVGFPCSVTYSFQSFMRPFVLKIDNYDFGKSIAKY